MQIFKPRHKANLTYTIPSTQILQLYHQKSTSISIPSYLSQLSSYLITYILRG